MRNGHLTPFDIRCSKERNNAAKLVVPIYKLPPLPNKKSNPSESGPHYTRLSRSWPLNESLRLRSYKTYQSSYDMNTTPVEVHDEILPAQGIGVQLIWIDPNKQLREDPTTVLRKQAFDNCQAQSQEEEPSTQPQSPRDRQTQPSFHPADRSAPEHERLVQPPLRARRSGNPTLGVELMASAPSSTPDPAAPAPAPEPALVHVSSASSESIVHSSAKAAWKDPANALATAQTCVRYLRTKTKRPPISVEDPMGGLELQRKLGVGKTVRDEPSSPITTPLLPRPPSARAFKHTKTLTCRTFPTYMPFFFLLTTVSKPGLGPF